MTRRFQFSLRGLMTATVVVCVALSGWRFYWARIGTWLETWPDPARAGEHFDLRFYFHSADPWASVGAYEVCHLSNHAPYGYQSGNGLPIGETQHLGSYRFRFEIQQFPVTAGLYGFSFWDTKGKLLAHHVVEVIP